MLNRQTSQGTAAVQTTTWTNPARALLSTSSSQGYLTFLLFHASFAYISGFSVWIPTAHAWIVLLYGMRAAYRRDSAAVLGVLSYIAGAEILWRMVRTRVFWEFGKYSSVMIVLVFFMVVGRERGNRGRVGGWNLLYLALLVPSIVQTFTVANFNVIGAVSFNLSGHLAFALVGVWLHRRSFNRQAFIKMCRLGAAPVLTIFIRAATGTANSTLEFSLESSFIASGGYGPNQVSNMLSFGALLCILYVLNTTRKDGHRLLMALMALAFTGQSLLTFSRGGGFSLILAAMAIGVHAIASPQARRRFLLFGAFIGTIMYVWIFPFLDNLTSNLLTQRFVSGDTTGRIAAVQGDLLAFQTSPIFGVGVGLSYIYRNITFGRSIAAHTESTRLLAEHGLFGIGVLVMMVALPLMAYYRTKVVEARGVIAGLSVWGFSVMFHSAMRFMAMPLCIALSLAEWDLSEESEAEKPANEPPRPKRRVNRRRTNEPDIEQITETADIEQ